AKFREVAIEHFGDAAKDAVGDSDAELARAMTEVDSLAEQVTGDKASVGIGDRNTHLLRVDGKWRVPVSSFAEGVDAQTIDRAVTDMNGSSSVYTETAQE